MKKKTLKICAALLAFALIGFVLVFASAFMGNPLSKLIVSINSKNYIEKNYSDLDLVADSPFYSFKTGGYSVYVRSESSVDTHFNLSYDIWGRLEYDSYENDVLTKNNTFGRINDDYFKAVNSAEDTLPVECDIFFGDIECRDYVETGFDGEPRHEPFGYSLDELIMDGTYDTKETGKKAGRLTAYAVSNDGSAENAAEMLLKITEHLESRGIYFYAVDFVIRSPRIEGQSRDNLFNIECFLRSDIYEDGLAERLQKADEELDEYYRRADEEGK